MDKRINRSELLPGLARAFYGLAIMYMIFLGGGLKPEMRFELSMGALFFTLFLFIVSLAMPEDWQPGVWILFTLDILIVWFGIVSFGGMEGWPLFVLPLLIVSAVFRFPDHVSLSIAMILGVSVFVFSAVTQYDGTLFKPAFVCALMLACWSLGREMTRTATESKYKMLYFDQEKINSELEDRMRDMEKKFATQTMIDPVTGLKNFRYFRARIDEEIARAVRQKYPFSIALMHIDDLSEFTVMYGDEETRKAIRRVSEKLKEVFRTTDIIGRYDENQFLIMLPEAEDRQALIPIMRLRKTVESMNFGPARFSFTVSFGISCFPKDVREVGGLLSMAFAALRRSQDKGNGMITLASSLFKKGLET